MQSQAFSSLEDIPVPLLVCFGSFQAITQDGKLNNPAEVRMQTSTTAKDSAASLSIATQADK